MAARRFQPFLNPAAQLYNLPTDPSSYPVFRDFDERDEYIRDLLLVDYHTQVTEDVREEIQGEDLEDWLPDQVAEWATENNFKGSYDFKELARQIADLVDLDGDQQPSQQPGNQPPPGSPQFDTNAYDFRQGPQHLPIRRRFQGGQPRLYPDPAPRSSTSRGRSRERSRSPSRRNPSPERRGDSAESSLARRGRRGESPHSGGRTRSRSNSRERSPSPATPRGRRPRYFSAGFSDPFDSRSPGSESSSDSAQSIHVTSSGYNTPQHSPGSRSNPPQPSDNLGFRVRRPLDARAYLSMVHQVAPVFLVAYRSMLNQDASLTHEEEAEMATSAHQLMFERELQQRMKPFEDMFYIAFVGDQSHPPVDGFEPCRGDLIISHPDSRHIGQPDSVGYIASYLGEYNFTRKDLVLRVGSLETTAASGAYPGGTRYEPFTALQLNAYNPTRFSSWKFLGHQARLRNGYDYRNPPDVSPGKFLRVGTPVLGPSSNFVEALVPRRGDVVIKREAWVEDFSHAWNFWYSMVKWHKGRQFPFLPGDMLVRLLVDSSVRNQKWGWAELYKYEGTSVGWIFWGRTKHVYDTPWPLGSPRHIVLYEYDDGADSDDESHKETVDPRLDPE